MNMTKEKIWSFFSNLEQPYKCSAGSKMVNIDSDGTIYPCQILIQKTSEKENILGNLNDFKIEDFRENREKFLNKNIKSGKCLDCISYYSCSTCLGVDNYKKDCRKHQKNTEEVFEILSDYILEDKIDSLLEKLSSSIQYL